MIPLPTPPAGDSGVRLPLLRDGSLRIEAAPGLAHLVTRWLPDLPPSVEAPCGPGGAAIRLLPAFADAPGSAVHPPGRRTLRLGPVSCHVADDEARATLVSASGAVSGAVDLAGLDAVLRVGDAERDGVEPEVFTMATISAALLLGRLGRALVHAAAIVAPDGRAWLLSGDTHAGKTTTTVNLIEAGWRYVSDDHVVLSADAESGALIVEGWPRRFHLDDGWDGGAPVGRRGSVDPRGRWPGRWMRSAPLAGLLFPRVRAAKPTLAEPVPPAAALAALLRQSPWLMADRPRAASLLALLQSAAALPSYGLRVGLDTYRSPPTLVERLAPVTG
ncbi:MAG: hypothetical protein JWM27_4503 [Gemmatimonadetes bacterium]|nr:hypothetical protein [Gemmatimonadota bacterium]